MTAQEYYSSLRAPVVGLWRREFTLEQFHDSFRSAVDRGLTRAWHEGAMRCGIRPDELSGEERAELAKALLLQHFYIWRYGESIVAQKSREEGGKLQPHIDRLALWLNRYNETTELAAAMACGDRKVKWVLGGTKKHCGSCSTFNGRVYRYSTWLANGALPQSRALG
jgi:hypothetical protein